MKVRTNIKHEDNLCNSHCIKGKKVLSSQNFVEKYFKN